MQCSVTDKFQFIFSFDKVEKVTITQEFDHDISANGHTEGHTLCSHILQILIPQRP